MNFQGKGENYEFTFSGLNQVSRGQLLSAAQRALVPFRNGEGTPADVANAAYSMELWLKQQGFAQAAVDFRYFNGPDGNRTYFETDRNWDATDGTELS